MKKLFTLVMLVLVTSTLAAQNSTTRFFFAYQYGNLTVDGTSGGVPFPAAKVDVVATPMNSAQLVTFTVACASGTTCVVRFTLDGTAPTTTVGMRAFYGDTVSIYSHTSIVAFRAIRESDSAVLNVTYFR